MASFTIFIRKPGEDKEEMVVTRETTVADVKALKGLKGHVLCFRGNRKDGDTMAILGIAAGETINVCKTTCNPNYYATRRLKLSKDKRGGTARSTAHPSLHAQTQAVVVDAVMSDGDQTRRALATVGQKLDRVEKKLETTTPATSTVPSEGSAALMADVLSKCTSSRCSALLKYFSIANPQESKHAQKARLLAEQAPTAELRELLELSGEALQEKLATRIAELRSARSGPRRKMKRDNTNTEEAPVPWSLASRPIPIQMSEQAIERSSDQAIKRSSDQAIERAIDRGIKGSSDRAIDRVIE